MRKLVIRLQCGKSNSFYLNTVILTVFHHASEHLKNIANVSPIINETNLYIFP